MSIRLHRRLGQLEGLREISAYWQNLDFRVVVGEAVSCFQQVIPRNIDRDVGGRFVRMIEQDPGF